MRLAFYISGHGLGHLAQSAPVINALSAIAPEISWTVMSAIPEAQLRARIAADFEHRDWRGDPGFVMVDALNVDRERSRSAWARSASTHHSAIAEETHQLQARGIDGVITNIGHLPVAAAHALGLPRVAVCSLNWADVYAAFYPEDATHALLRESYEKLHLFIRPTPAMPVTWLANTEAVSPIASRGINLRTRIAAATGFSPDTPLGLISGGGHEFEIHPESWPTQSWNWLIPGDSPLSNGCVGIDQLDCAFIDLIESVDVVVAKPGYGLFAEATCAGKPMLYLDRSEWPEQPAILDWRSRYGRIAEISAEQLQSGQIGAPADRVISMPAFDPPRPTGADEAARLILKTLKQHG